jgi:hypothetical protein
MDVSAAPHLKAFYCRSAAFACVCFTGASTDSKFSWGGYSWQVANCMFTSAYALYLRSVMDKVSEHTTNKQKMDEYSMVYYNNLLVGDW